MERQKPIGNDIQGQMQAFLDYIRAKEQLPDASFVVTIDKEKLAQLPIPTGDGHGIRSAEQKQIELTALRDRFSLLPSELSFQEGITLIVGKNGTGKTTLAKSLWLAAKYQGRLEECRVDGLRRKDPNVFAYAEAYAMKYTYEPSTMHGFIYDRLWLTQAGLAPEIGKTMQVHGTYPGGVSNYIDVPELIGERRTTEARHYMEYPQDRERGFVGWDDHLSHRQSVEHWITNELRKETEYKTQEAIARPTLYFLEEFESGKDIEGQERLVEEMYEITIPGSVIILPTNSWVLFHSDLPRIDLRYPERGIHRPSEYAA